MKNKIIILTGPTGVGKTKFSIELAKKINGEIISCDSFQVYRYMDIGTAKITEEEKCGIIHHNIDVINPDEDFNVAIFKRRTDYLINDIISRGKVPILVGGTGLYIHSVIYDLEFLSEKSNPDIRKKIDAEIQKCGVEKLFDELLTIDGDLEKYVDRKNRHRVARAWEIYLNTGKLPSEVLNNFRKLSDKYDFLYFVLVDDRQKLYDVINKRVEIMFELGLLEEINLLLNKGYSFNLRSFKAIGYKEFEDYFLGDITLDEVKNKIKQHSRNYAKRQLTWFRREKDSIFVDKNNFKSDEEITEYLIKMSEEFLNE